MIGRLLCILFDHNWESTPVSHYYRGSTKVWRSVWCRRCKAKDWRTM